MRSRGWTVKLCKTEVDVAIAQDAQPSDIIISTDNDMFAYISIVTIWRPVSKLVSLVYKVPDVLLTLGITRNQMTALAVVSRNDYQRNIHSLGLAANYGVIKKITRSTETRQIVSAYLLDKVVVTKNTNHGNFENSIRVFVLFGADSNRAYHLPAVIADCVGTLKARHKEFCQEQDLRKVKQESGTSSRWPSDAKDGIVRLKASRIFNRYRTVKSPALSSGSSQPKHSLSPQDADPSTTLPHQEISHPALNRTRIPRLRLHFLFKVRQGKMNHKFSPKAKQPKWKPRKKPAEPVRGFLEMMKSIIEAEAAKRRKERDDQVETLSENDRLAARRSALSSDQREVMNYL
ncbi:hypothetical protein BGZ97_005052 [Linnemannia gamsii]|uniref:XPG-I domain-containing protein n=1 Tax=Linnemannia gamsii TaxID=64522 RepID=A0A9P6UGF3_9FUNG|nr:hypothetical protein BGZ97_005052 [Linnemannia gamsii]